nr:MAG TPA: hypothetical protein [Caudoviricetes sp.]
MISIAATVNAPTDTMPETSVFSSFPPCTGARVTVSTMHQPVSRLPGSRANMVGILRTPLHGGEHSLHFVQIVLTGDRRALLALGLHAVFHKPLPDDGVVGFVPRAFAGDVQGQALNICFVVVRVISPELCQLVICEHDVVHFSIGFLFRRLCSGFLRRARGWLFHSGRFCGRWRLRALGVSLVFLQAERCKLFLIVRRMVSVTFERVVHAPVPDDNDAGIKDDDKALCKEQLQIVRGRADIVRDALRVVDEPVVIRAHIQVKIQRLRGERHIQKRIAVDERARKHSLFCHGAPRLERQVGFVVRQFLKLWLIREVVRDNSDAAHDAGIGGGKLPHAGRRDRDGRFDKGVRTQALLAALLPVAGSIAVSGELAADDDGVTLFELRGIHGGLIPDLAADPFGLLAAVRLHGVAGGDRKLCQRRVFRTDVGKLCVTGKSPGNDAVAGSGANNHGYLLPFFAVLPRWTNTRLFMVVFRMDRFRIS